MKNSKEIFRKFEYWILGSGLLLMTFILCANVILRRVFNLSLSWAEEAARYIMVWITFWGASICVYEGGNISIDSIVNYLSTKGKRVLSIITIIVSIIFSGIIIYLSMDLTIQVMKNKQFSTALNIPISYVYAAMPVGATLTLIRYLEQLWHLIKDKGKEEEN